MMAKDRRHNAKGRSTGRAIPGRKHFKLVGQFAPRAIDMLRSPAMRVLSLSARRLLDRLEIEHADHGGSENGRLPVTYADLVAFGLDRHAVSPAIRECVALGFVEVTEQGRAGNADSRMPSKFRITYRPTAEAGPTNEWMRVGMTPKHWRLPKQLGPKNKTPVGENATFRWGKPTPKSSPSRWGKPTLQARWGNPHYFLYLGGEDQQQHPSRAQRIHRLRPTTCPLSGAAELKQSLNGKIRFRYGWEAQ